MSLTSYRAAPPRDGFPLGLAGIWDRLIGVVWRDTGPTGIGWLLARFGGDLLSHVLRRSTIGVPALNGRVRDGIGCFAGAMTTKPRKKPISVGVQRGLRGCALRGSCCTAAPCGAAFAGTLSSAVCYICPSLVCCIYPEPVILRSALLLLDQIKPIERLVPVN